MFATTADRNSAMNKILRILLVLLSSLGVGACTTVHNYSHSKSETAIYNSSSGKIFAVKNNRNHPASDNVQSIEIKLLAGKQSIEMKLIGYSSAQSLEIYNLLHKNTFVSNVKLITSNTTTRTFQINVTDPKVTLPKIVEYLEKEATLPNRQIIILNNKSGLQM